MNSRLAWIALAATLFSAAIASAAAEHFYTGQFTTSNGYTPNLTLLTGPHFLTPAPQKPTPAEQATYHFVWYRNPAPAPTSKPVSVPGTLTRGTLTLSSSMPVKAATAYDTLRFDATLPAVPTALLRKPASNGWLYFKPAAPAQK